MDISEWRSRIEEIDIQLVRLLNARARCVIEIGKVKKAKKLELYDPEREAEVLRIVTAHNPGPLENEAVKRLFERIIDESRRLERIATE